MECDNEEQAEQESEKLKAISDPGQPSKREREDHEAAAHAQYRSWCVACVREEEVSQRSIFEVHLHMTRGCTRSSWTTAFRHKVISKEQLCWS